jgi:enterochelin esterase-like enzyme
MGRSLPYRVYLPPCYQPSHQTDYPVLILIHGLQSTDSQWDDLGVSEAADALIRAGELPPTVIVMPWERKGLDFESAIVDVLLPHIRATYAGEGDRDSTAIGGLSRGAGWALRIGLKHPEVFGSIGLHSPAVLPPDMYYVAGWVKAARESSTVPRLWIDIADHDTSRAGAVELAAVLADLGLSYAWSTAPGEHSADYWSSRLTDYLRWYGQPWTNSADAMGAAPS